MLTLNDGRTEIWQWDTGRTLSVDAECSQVHFSNKVFGRSIDVDVAGGVAIIPDILLQTDKDLNVWAFVGTAENGYTKISKTFNVNRRNKPADYVFTQTDQITLQTIQSQIGDLADLTTEAKDTLVAAINEAARTGGGAGSMDLRVADGYVQYSTDGGMTWTNLIAMAELKGADGKSAYAYAVEGGYTGTEAEFAAKLAAEKFANPNALTFTGAVTGSYDGSEAVTVEIPSGGGGSGGGEAEFPNWRLIKTISFSADIAYVEFDTDDNGNTFSLKEIMLAGSVPAYSGYIYMKPKPAGYQNTIWPTAAKDLRWWAASVSGKLKTMLAVSNASAIWPIDRDPVCENDTISRLVIGASDGFTADGTMYVYGR